MKHESEPQLLLDDLETSDLLIPYKDDIGEDDSSSPQMHSEAHVELPLPEYEPMHDYLRRQEASRRQALPAPHMRPKSMPLRLDTTYPPPFQAQEPLLICISESNSSPTPSYESLHHDPREIELQSVWRGFQARGDEAEEEVEEDDGLQVEDLARWVLVMLMISLIVAFIGTLFDWGRAPQCGSSMHIPC